MNRSKTPEHCAVGWNDQDYKTHSTNLCIAPAIIKVTVRVSRTKVAIVPVCQQHYAEWQKDRL